MEHSEDHAPASVLNRPKLQRAQRPALPPPQLTRVFPGSHGSQSTHLVFHAGAAAIWKRPSAQGSQLPAAPRPQFKRYLPALHPSQALHLVSHAPFSPALLNCPCVHGAQALPPLLPPQDTFAYPATQP